MKVDAQKEAELRALVAETPCDSHHWPTHFMGCVPFVEVEVEAPRRYRLTYRVESVDKYGPPALADAAILYGKRLAQASNALPLLLDDLDRLRLVLRETRDAVKYAVDHVLPDGAVRDDFAEVQRKAELALGDET